MPSPDAGRRGRFAHVPLAWTSLLVAGVTVLAVVLVTVVTPPGKSPGPGASAVAATDTRSPTFVVHPPPPTTVAPTTVPPTTAAPLGPSSRSTSTPVAPPRLPQAPARPAPAPVPAGASVRAILPPAVPPANVAPSPDFTSVCVQDGFDSGPCLGAAGQATAAARGREGLGPLALPSNYVSLTPAEQLFVLTDVERVDRGLPPVVGMVPALDQDAQAGAAGNTDPTPSALPPGSTALRWASNWAEAAGPMGSHYMWMYDDGPGSGNTGCSTAASSSCWGHRDNILGFDAAQVAAGGTLVMGTAEVTGTDGQWSSDAELIALVTGSPTFAYTWAQAQLAGAR